MSALEAILKDLKKFPPDKLAEAPRFVDQLRGSAASRTARAQEAIWITAGCMPGKEGEAFERAVNEESERQC